MPVVAASEIFAYKLIFQTCSEVTFSPVLFFIFLSVAKLKIRMKLVEEGRGSLHEIVKINQ